MRLKVLSWNVYCRNRRFDKALRFIDAHEADVLCLQEVPVEVLQILKRESRFYISEAMSHDHGKKQLRTRNVIISRYPVLETKSFQFKDEKKRSIKSRLSKLTGPLEFHYVDILVGGKKVRVFNSHLECNTSPRVRAEQFKQVVKESKDDRINIYCGDLNTYGKWYINLFVGYFSNYTFKDISQSEKKLFNKLFNEYNLLDVFSGHVTYPRFLLQLDHILIPKSIKVIAKKVYKQRYGSDHRPVFVEVEI
jgi:endonuclease/exonuclease/phosphatase family metal-dependent hydrolase